MASRATTENKAKPILKIKYEVDLFFVFVSIDRDFREELENQN